MGNNLPSHIVPAETDPEAVFAALDKVVAETPLVAQRWTGGAKAEQPEPETAGEPSQTVSPERMTDLTLELFPTVASRATPTHNSVPEPAPEAASAISKPNESPSAVPLSWPAPMPVARASTEQPRRPTIVGSAATAVVDWLDEVAEVILATPRWRRAVGVALVLLIAVVVVQAAFLIWDRRERVPVSVAGPSSVTGTVVVESTPEGATIVINGQDLGKTPATLTLQPGEYTMEITSGSVSQRSPMSIQAGAAGTQHFHFAEATGAGPLQVSSQPSGARISVDGSVRGVTPLTISDLGPGSHAVVVEALPVAPPSGAATGGWVSVVAPIEVQLFEAGSLLGSSQSARIMLPAGRHVIDVLNASLGYQTKQTVQIGAGAVSRLTLDVPTAAVAINAVPWAEVSIDGKALGPTPLGNVQVPIGSHEVVFRHPQLGERRQTAVVTVKGPNRISANLNQR